MRWQTDAGGQFGTNRPEQRPAGQHRCEEIGRDNRRADQIVFPLQRANVECQRARGERGVRGLGDRDLLSGAPRRSSPQCRQGPGPSLEISPGNGLPVRGHASRTRGSIRRPGPECQREKRDLDSAADQHGRSPTGMRITRCGKRSCGSRGERIRRQGNAPADSGLGQARSRVGEDLLDHRRLLGAGFVANSAERR